MLTQAQIDSYRTNGYLGVENVLSAQEVAELRRVTDEFVEKSRQVTGPTDVFDLEPGHSPEAPRLRRIKDPGAHHSVYDHVCRHEGIVDIVAQLVGPNVRLSASKLNMKSAGFGSAVEWHQDWAFQPHTNEDYLTVGVTIDDMTIQNGALMVIPDSHRGRIYSHHQDGRFIGAVTEPDFGQRSAVPIELEAGGISIHHVRTLHASAPNTQDRPRRLLLIDYCAADAWPLMWTPDWTDFTAAVVRGEWTREPRMVAVPVRIPLPGDSGGVIYELQSELDSPILAKKAR